MGFPTGGFPTHGESLSTLTATLLGQPILYQPVLLGQLGPDVSGMGFGFTTWTTSNFVGTWTAGLAFSVGAQDLVAGYVSQEAESIKKITVFAQTAPVTTAAVINVYAKAAGGVWTATGDSITLAIGETFGQITCDIPCALGTTISFDLDSGSADWLLGQGGVSIYGLRVKE